MPADAILELLTTRQYLRPHQNLGEVLAVVGNELGCCPVAMQRAMEWLNLDEKRSVGRLRRSELSQLARSIDRFWQQQTSATPVVQH